MNQPSILPFSDDAEKGLLCSMMLSEDTLSECKGVPVEAFYYPAHQIVFKVLLEFHEKNRPIDFVPLKHSLHTSNQLEEVGGVEHLNDLWQFVPTSANWKYYLDILLDRHHRRVTIIACQKISAFMHDLQSETSSSIQNIAERALTKLAIRTLTKDKTFKEQVLDTIEELQDSTKTVTTKGAIFGIKSLDDLLLGMLPAELWVIAAETSQGKSALAMQAALRTGFDKGLYTIIFSLEMQATEVIKRMMSHAGNISMRFMRDGLFPDVDHARLTAVTTRLGLAPFHIYDDFDMDWKGIVSNCRKKQVSLAREGKKIGFVVIDYLQLIDGDGNEERKELEISKIVKGSKSLSKEMQCPVLAISQLNDSGKLYGARSIKHHADGLLLMKPSKSEEEGRVDIHVAKMRNGPKDKIASARFYGQSMTFETRGKA